MRKRYILASMVGILTLSYIASTYQEMHIIDLINQQLDANPSSSGKQTFEVLDATKFSDSMYPWIGFPVIILSEQQLLGEGDNSNVPPNELLVKEVLFKYKDKKRLIINIPSWQIASDKEQDVMTKLHVQWYVQVVEWAKEVLPDTNIGIFGIPYSPLRALKSTENDMLNYQRLNELLQPMIIASDTLYPLFQVLTDEANDLYYSMGVQLYIAKTSGKPVYPVISHKSEAIELDQLISIDLIKKQCDFVRKNADGMVWWSASNEQWDNRWYEAVSEHCFL